MIEPFQRHQTLKAARVKGLMQYINETELHLPGPIDEVSLLFDGPESLEKYRQWAVETGMANFARVSSDEATRLETSPGADSFQRFEVRFEFLRFPGADWRIEAMCILDGDAPLHENWLNRFGNGCVVHASYKVGSGDAYDRHCRQGPHASFWPSQPRHRASYVNSYGRFAYYEHPNFQYGETEWLLKPRVNERDVT